jgi:hypothetical protein
MYTLSLFPLTQAGSNPMHTFRETIDLGPTNITPRLTTTTCLSPLPLNL